MTGSVAQNQQRVLLEFLARLRPHWRRSSDLPARIENLLRRDRRLGSRDRRLYRELIYTVLRHLPWIEPLLDDDPQGALKLAASLAAETPATRAFLASTPRSGAISGLDPAELLPAWFYRECPEAAKQPLRDALLRRAPLWLRLQAADAARVLDEFTRLGWPFRRSEILPSAVRIDTEADVTRTESYRRGLFEIQDVGSQLILEFAGIEPGARWLDACAGAGGKTLQLAAMLGPAGRVDAEDVRADALREMEKRAARAGLASRIRSGARERPPVYDGVLVDAPCSGTGTWRRAPHLKWSTRPAGVASFARLQLGLLDRFAAFVRPGGRLIYATCSLCSSENESVAERFLASHRAFGAEVPQNLFTGERRGAGVVFWPHRHDGDGFFAAYFKAA